MSVADLLQTVVPLELSTEARQAFVAGLQIGISSERPGPLEAEQQIIRELQVTLNTYLSEYRSLLHGMTIGLDYRMEAERNAAELSRRLGAFIPLSILKCVLVRPRHCEQIFKDLTAADGVLLVRAYRTRYGMDPDRIARLICGERRAHGVCTYIQEASTGTQSPVERDIEKSRSISDEVQSLRQAIHGAIPVWPGVFFLGRPPEHRVALRGSFTEQFGPLEVALSTRFSNWELEILLDVVREGRVTWGKLLYLCVTGIGTDEQGLRDLLREMSPHDRKNAREEFTRLWNRYAPWYERPFPHLLGNLERRIWIETGGDSFFELNEYLECTSDDTTTSFTRVDRLYEHERSGVLLRRVDAFAQEGQVMDRDVLYMRDFFTKYLPRAEGGIAAELRGHMLVRFSETDCVIFRGVKHALGNTITGVIAAGSAGCAALALTLEHLDVATIMTVVALVSIVVRLSLKRLLKGRGYHPGELTVDVLFGAVDGATLFTTYLFRQTLLRLSTKCIASIGARTGLLKVSRLLGGNRSIRWGVSLTDLAGSSQRK